MRADRMRQSGNVEDRRGMRGGKVAVGGVGGLILVIVIILLGGNPAQLLNPGGGGGPVVMQPGGGGPTTPEQDAAAEFVARVLGDTEDVWTDLFRQMGREYRPPTLVLFTNRVDSACGSASTAVGPFYCPADQKVYIDLSFFDDLKSQYGAPGDFAQAYVIGHEVAHHVQNLLGNMDRVHGMRGRVSEAESNDLSVRLELQADFLAGVWAHHANKARNVLEVGDVEEGLRAAAAIGDDRLQRRSQGYVVPDSFTHGTSAQRVKWFKKGFETGDIRAGDTFGVDTP
jgi:predicted metalloprotease